MATWNAASAEPSNRTQANSLVFDETWRWASFLQGELNEMERYLCLGMLAYLDRGANDPASTNARAEMQDSLTKIEPFAPDVCDVECMIWVAMNIAAMHDSTDELLPSQWQLLDRVWQLDARLWEWDRLVEVLKRYFWTDLDAPRWFGTWQLAMANRSQCTSQSVSQSSSRTSSSDSVPHL